MIPEFIADVGTKKGEKIDYAVAHDGRIQLLIEVKKSMTTENRACFPALPPYTDLDAPDRMDAKPFPPEANGDVITTEEEVEGYRIVRATVCGEVPASRVIARDTKTYCGVLLDDDKVECRVPIDRVEDICQHAEHLRRTVARFSRPDPVHRRRTPGLLDSLTM